MNANELADEVEYWSKIWDCNIINVTKFSKEAATMLRQQQNEIEEWKRKYKDMHNLATQAMSKVHELEKAQKNG